MPRKTTNHTPGDQSHDQYGTHDEKGNGPARSRAVRDDTSANEAPQEKKVRGPDYGNGRERAVRTSKGGAAEFQGRDFERENYGGGFGVQRKTRDVPAGGRRSPGAYRGQAGGTGLDGLASERAFGAEEDKQMSKLDTEAANLHRREARDRPKPRA